jgi:hypothetical protein
MNARKKNGGNVVTNPVKPYTDRASQRHIDGVDKRRGIVVWETAVKQEVIRALIDGKTQNAVRATVPGKGVTAFEYAAAALHATEAFSQFLRFAVIMRGAEDTLEEEKAEEESAG